MSAKADQDCPNMKLFLDFMGFSDAVERWADEQLGEVIDTLENLASVQSASMLGRTLSDGSYKITGHAVNIDVRGTTER